MIKKQLIPALITIIIFGCSNPRSSTTIVQNNTMNTDSILEVKFFAALSEFILKTPNIIGSDISSSTDIEAKKSRFFFVKRVMLPLSYNGITYDLWTYRQCDGGCPPYNFLFVHNASDYFLLPLTDDHAHSENSTNSSLDTMTSTNFTKYLNRMIATFSISKESSVEVIDIVMDFRGYSKLYQEDIPKLQYVIARISENNLTDKECINELNKSISTTKNWINHGEILFNKGPIVLRFYQKKDGDWALEALNTKCAKTISL